MQNLLSDLLTNNFINNWKPVPKTGFQLTYLYCKFCKLKSYEVYRENNKKLKKYQKLHGKVNIYEQAQSEL